MDSNIINGMVVPGQLRSDDTSKLDAKIVAIMEEVTEITKDGFNTFNHYAYASYEGMVESVRSAFVKQKIVLNVNYFRKEALVTENKSGGLKVITTTDGYLVVRDAESGQFFTMFGYGDGEDSGDKGSYKGMTGMLKYLIKNLLFLPSADDPEATDESGKRTSAGKGRGQADLAEGDYIVTPRESAIVFKGNGWDLMKVTCEEGAFVVTDKEIQALSELAILEGFKIKVRIVKSAKGKLGCKYAKKFEDGTEG